MLPRLDRHAGDVAQELRQLGQLAEGGGNLVQLVLVIVATVSASARQRAT